MEYFQLLTVLLVAKGEENRDKRDNTTAEMSDIPSESSPIFSSYANNSYLHVEYLPQNPA